MYYKVLAILGVVAFLGCEGQNSVSAPDIPRADASAGHEAFTAECASCHAAGDGFDLALFNFSDTTIIRRALGHVDSSTSQNIVAYIRTLGVPPVAEETRIFQPGGEPLAGDVEFAVSLFGRDAWPEELSTAELLGIDPRGMRIAVPLPIWSDEGSNLDWMPDAPLPEGILQYSGRLAEAAIAGYRSAPTNENLRRAVLALRSADRVTANPGALCTFAEPDRVRYVECFEVRRWTSTLVAQHMLRYGTQALSPDVHDVWWDVGNAARKSRTDPTQTVENVNQNWATWMFLGWSFDPSRHPSVYTGGGFQQLGLPRHATVVAVRSQVARPRNSPMVYDDLAQAARFAPNEWTTAVTRFSLEHLLERLATGDRPMRPEQITEAIADVNRAILTANRKIPVADRAELQALAGQVIAALTE